MEIFFIHTKIMIAKKPSVHACSLWCVGLDNVCSFSHCASLFFYLFWPAIYVMIWNLDVFVFFCGLEKDHRYFQFAKWMRKARKKEPFSFTKRNVHTISQKKRKLLAKGTETDCVKVVCKAKHSEQSEREKNTPLL